MELATLPSDLGASSPALPAPVNGRTPRLVDILEKLREPFSLRFIEVRAGATTRDKTRCLALPYADSRLYQSRLDRVVGVDGWSLQLIPWGDTRIIARLTVLGVTKDSTGEGDPRDPNCGTIAEAQAFKRACASFGLGRYLYQLEPIWCDYQEDSKSIVNPEQVAREIYHRAGLIK